MKNLFDYFRKPGNPFSKFALSVFQDSLSHTVLFVFWRILMETVSAPAGWWPCACMKNASGLRKSKKNLILWRCLHFIDLVLKYCSDINKRNWLQLLFYFLFFDGFICLGFWNEFFSVFQFLGWSNLVLLFTETFGMDSKTICLQRDWFLVLFLEYGFFHWLHICMDWNLHELLKLVFFLMTSSLSITPLGDTLGYFLNMLVLFSGGVL